MPSLVSSIRRLLRPRPDSPSTRIIDEAIDRAKANGAESARAAADLFYGSALTDEQWIKIRSRWVARWY
jgi:hypothetical protein